PDWATSGHTRPEYWLQPGPMLPQHTWQRRTRSVIILASALAGLLLAGVAVVALMVGSVNAATFSARGVVICASGDGQIATGTAVRIYDETGDELASTQLGAPRTDGGRCELPFTADDVPAARGGYVVRVGDAFQETVSESALEQGTVLRPVS
ncbi:MAG: hypothetical protein SW127_23330, partial [Actinomycetota bacterium]|nr:hypothetical protein [Actinomycetota bacterium]